jgi:hypothetical protein
MADTEKKLPAVRHFYSEEWAKEFCELIAEGKSVRDICQHEPNQPDPSQVYRWLELHAELREQYARARQRQADNLVERAMQRVEDVKADTAEVSRARLQFDAMRWHVGKLAPKVYGDRIEHDVKGGVNFQPQILIQCSSDQAEPQVKIATHHEPDKLQ